MQYYAELKPALLVAMTFARAYRSGAEHHDSSEDGK
jgi:hypothetical protein